MAKRFLVTGGTGFIGGCLVRRLIARGQEVHVLSRGQASDWRVADIRKQIRVHQVDLRDGAALERVLADIRAEIVFHCAAFGAYPAQQDPVHLAEVNVLGTVNLVVGLMRVGFECLVNTSSSAEYGVKAKPMAEDDLPEPNTAYGATKVGATLFCQTIARTKQQPIITCRVFSPYGPYMEPTPLIAAVIRKALDGESPMLTSGDQTRDFFFVEDLVDLYLQIPEARWTPGEIVNVGSGEQHTVRGIVTRIIKLTGGTVQPVWDAMPPRPFDTSFWVADLTKIKSLFGWSPKVSIDEGLRRTIEWQRGLGPARMGTSASLQGGEK